MEKESGLSYFTVFQKGGWVGGWVVVGVDGAVVAEDVQGVGSNAPSKS